jgi:hypothetical protein
MMRYRGASYQLACCVVGAFCSFSNASSAQTPSDICEDGTVVETMVRALEATPQSIHGFSVPLTYRYTQVEVEKDTISGRKIDDSSVECMASVSTSTNLRDANHASDKIAVDVVYRVVVYGDRFRVYILSADPE